MSQEHHKSSSVPRSLKVADRLWKNLSSMLHTEIRDPRVSFVTISGVNLSPDLRHARVYFSLLVDEDKASEITAVLNKAVPYLRSKIAKKMALRVVPDLFFVYDDTTVQAFALQKRLDDNF
jgi:ribosome-binding factor A